MQGNKIIFCTKCVTPSTRPRINFNKDFICNACLNSKEKNNIDWKNRQIEFEDILSKYRSNKGEWDCVVPWSGGKDSSSIAWKLKFKFKMNPLLVTFSPILPTTIGNLNRESLLEAGFDNYLFRSNQLIHRKLAKRFFIERANPKVAWDAGINVVPVQIALKYNIKLIFYAEHGESEYGGKVLSEESKKSRNFTEVLEHQIGDDPRNWIDEEISISDLNPYIYPNIDEIESNNIKAYYFAYYNKWNAKDNYDFIKEKINFRLEPSGRTCGTFTNYDSLCDKFDDLYYYMMYIKFGFGRCIRDCSRWIQNDMMTRNEAIELCKKYDGEFPSKNLDHVLDYLDLDMKEMNNIIDLHRNKEIWKLNKSNKSKYELSIKLK